MNPHADRDRSEAPKWADLWGIDPDFKPMPDPHVVLRDRVEKALADSIEHMKRRQAVLSLATLQDDLAAALATQEPPDVIHAPTEPHSDADRVNAYAALCDPTESWIASDGYRSVGFRSAEEIARAVIALADREQAALREEIDTLWAATASKGARIAELEALLATRASAASARSIHSIDSSIRRSAASSAASEAESKVAELESEVERLRGDHLYSTSKAVEFRVRAEDAERALADERAKVAAIEALHVEEWKCCSHCTDESAVPYPCPTILALAGHAEPEASETDGGE
jgi:hypothetical protein